MLGQLLTLSQGELTLAALKGEAFTASELKMADKAFAAQRAEEATAAAKKALEDEIEQLRSDKAEREIKASEAALKAAKMAAKKNAEETAKAKKTATAKEKAAQEIERLKKVIAVKDDIIERTRTTSAAAPSVTAGWATWLVLVVVGCFIVGSNRL